MTQNPPGSLPGEDDQARSPWAQPTAWNPAGATVPVSAAVNQPPAEPTVPVAAPQSTPAPPPEDFSPVQPTWHYSNQQGYQPVHPAPQPIAPVPIPAWPTAPRPPMPRPVSYPAPVRVEVVPGAASAYGPLGVAILPGPKMFSGLSVGSLGSGIGSILVASVVWCFGLWGADGGWGAIVSGAFCALAVLLGAAGVALGIIGLRQIRRHQGMSGRGLAITGLVCGGLGIVAAIAGLILAILLQA